MVPIVNKKFFSVRAVGVDIEKNIRFQKLEDAVLARIFTRNELDYCFSKKDPAPHLAVRFCAKEATIKALSGAGYKLDDLLSIEVIINKEGVPSLEVKGYEKQTFFLSLSHSKSFAIAFVVLI